MEKAWYWKITFVLALVVASVLYLLPTFLPGSLPSWYTDIFDKQINLGLDLKGGIHLVLGVEVDKALEDKADQYVSDFKEILQKKRIRYKRITRIPGTWDILFELEDPEELNKLKGRVIKEYANLTVVDSGEKKEGQLRISFDPRVVEELRRNARDQAEVVVRNRVDSKGWANPDIRKHGEEGILVQIAGETDPDRAKSLLGRTAQLEFKLVDDKSDFIQKLQEQLPEGISIETYPYRGPNDSTITEYYLVAKGKGLEGKHRILDFLNNVAEIEKFLKDKKVDPKVVEQIMGLAKGGISDVEHKEIVQLAEEVFSNPVQPTKTSPEPAGLKDSDVKTDSDEETVASLPEDKKDQNQDLEEFMRLLAGKVPANREIGFEAQQIKLETEYRTYYLVRETALTGDYITDAYVNTGNEGQPEVSLNFDRLGAKKFEKLTGAHVRERMAIVLEGEVNSAPVIQDRISGGRARITLGSSFDYDKSLEEARDLAAVLRAGALPAPVRILEERTVGAAMGEDAQRQGAYALALGLLLVVLFMVFYYKFSGLIADMALIINAIFILAVLVIGGATLTLPGIAGIILTIGMAVDANVIINERIREELRAGKTTRAAVDAGYSRAFWTIFDANFTTLIAAVVLWTYGSGPIRGFAVTLLIGILASMFTAIFVTRLVVDYLTVRFKIKHLSV